ncbi:CRISPR-associated protein Csy3 [Nitrosomonas sp. Nm51]|uniref:type I-F CRISPR-associated protein Csy3 n=1 Tax=Nitrosomonas sp. Nm51 TaxID=133720 RepID=UPI0008D6CF2D|nr:type I-F CRISPR-associated protein Csy3 [Nitrosomonas sp. Nm51]SER18095.1 CRISPR-associated protein Csy3 [Nitrosomonas sp. Nm51]
MSDKKIPLPSMLSFERKLECSDGLMFSGNWDEKEQENNWQSIPVIPRQNRSTQSAFGIKHVDKTKPNPVSSDNDDANLPMDKDSLKVSFSLRIVGNLGKPFACNKPDFAGAIEEKVTAFKNSIGIEELAFRYACNIANGRFLWRNRVCAEQVEIHVSHAEDGEFFKINAYDFSLNDFDKNRDNPSLQKLAGLIKKGLLGGDKTFVLIEVNAYVKLGKGQHVYPSQEMNMGEKKKKLFQLNKCAAMHNVKIGNAIRTIDTWYGNKMLIKAEGKDKTEIVNIESGNKNPIAIEPYGSVTQHGRAYRHTDIDFYSQMIDWINDKNIEEDQQKFVVANLIRGGVFGGDSEG